MYLILLGAPGVGKGTQAQLIMKEFHVPQISTGDMLRTEVKKGTPLGKRAAEIMEKGELVSDDLILQIVENRLRESDCRNGFILDGFPRTVPQAESLDTILKQLGDIHLRVVEVAVDDEEIVRRLLARGRADDREDTIRNRLTVYRKSTAPLVDYYRACSSYYRINGQQPIERVYADIKQIL